MDLSLLRTMFFKYSIILSVLFNFLGVAVIAAPTKFKPHIILIIADDLGWNDVGFHGSNEVSTPNIDALAYHGAILNRHYTQPICTPSRASLLTGQYPIRIGFQGDAIPSDVNVSLPFADKLMPQFLKNEGYATGLIGKWHLGFYNNKSVPNERGYDHFYGYYGGYVRYNDSKAVVGNDLFFDARRNFDEVGDEFQGKYNTDLYTEEAIKIITDHNTNKKDQPLFLQLAYTAVHSIENSGFQLRDEAANNETFGYIENIHRREFAGVLQALDESVGKIIQTLEDNQMLENSVVVFISDNGGMSEEAASVENPAGLGGGKGFVNYGSNWPMRGMKTAITEGGVRCPAAIWSPMLQKNVVLDNLMHISDWLATFNYIAGGDELLCNNDGVNQWEYLAGNDEEKPRHEILVNINEKDNSSALIKGHYKLLIRPSSASYKYYSESGRPDREYDVKAVLESTTHQVLTKYDDQPLTVDDFMRSRQATLLDNHCKARLREYDPNSADMPCFTTDEGCLFDLDTDACEFNDLSQDEGHKAKFDELHRVLRQYRLDLVKQWTEYHDPNADPSKHGGYVSPWE